MDEASGVLEKVERKVDGIQYMSGADELPESIGTHLLSKPDGTLWEP